MPVAANPNTVPAIRVIGGVRVVGTDRRPLSGAKRQLLALLVAAGPDGLTGATLASELGGSAGPVSGAALRMAMARLRDDLPDGWLPESTAGRYALACPDEHVDVWLLAEVERAGTGSELDDASLAHLLQAVAAFADVETTPMLDQAARRVAASQRSLLTAVLEQAPDRIHGALIGHMRRHRDEEPYDERLIFLTASRLAAIGDRRRALETLHTARRDFVELGLDPSTRLVELERRLLDGTHDREPEGTATVPAPSSLPPRLREQYGDAFVGDRTPVERASAHVRAGSGPVLVEGVTGAGKTRLVAEIAADAAAHGWAVVDVVGVAAAVGGSFAPFLAAVPAFRAEAAAIFARETDPASRRAALWVALRDAISSTTAPDGPAHTLLVVDDVHWLDSMSLEFVAHLLAAPGDTAIVLAGRSDAISRASWRTVRDAAQRAGALELALAPMTIDGIREVVRARHPRLGAATAWRLAEDVHARGGGWPGMALLLLVSVDDDWHLPAPRSLAVPPGLQDSLRDRVSAPAHDVGVAAAVIGEEFDLDLLHRLCERPPDEVLDAVDELIRHELLVERSPTRFATTHALVDAAFLQAAGRSQLARMHLRAATLVGDDVHRRARHLAEALPLADAEEVADALVVSARAYVTQDLHLEASRRYRSAAEATGRALAPDDAVAFSRSLDLSGLHADAERVRDEAFALAMAGEDMALALRAATSGLPEAEPIDGAPALVQRLQRIDPDRLPRDAAWVRDQQLARQLAIVGELDAAAATADRAVANASGRDEVVRSALVRRFTVSATSEPSTRLAILDAIAPLVDGVPAAVAAEYWVVRAIDLYEAGDAAGALEAHARLQTIDGLPIQRSWHAGLFEATVAADRGDVAVARALRRETFDMASRAGLREAENAYLIGEFVDLFLDGSAGILIGGVDDGSLDPDENTLMRAGVCAVLAQAGQVERALPHAELVATSVLRSPVSQGVAALALVAAVLGRSGDVELRERARRMLLTRGRSAVMIGAGAACVGPIDRYAAMLAVDASTRDAHHRDAQAFAGTAGVPRWSALAAGA